MIQRLSYVSLLVVLLSTCTIFVGCRGDEGDEGSSNLQDMASIKIDDVTILFPQSFGTKDILTENEVTKLVWSEHTIELDHGKLTVDDEIYGIISDGEMVTVAENGTVTVDGEPRAPVKISNITFGGVRFTLEGSSGSVTHENGADRFIDMLGRQVELDNNQLSVDGRSYGSLEEGDEVRVSMNGSIIVNGELLEP